MAECLFCGKPPARNFYKYCSNACQKKAQRPEFDALKTDRSRKSRLLEDRGRKCESCGHTEWLGKPIPLDLDHIDGHHSNNDPSNLRLICPNCHALTDSYKGKNKGRGRAYRMERYYANKSY